MRYIIQNKVYDTEKMTLVGAVKKWYKFQSWFCQQLFGADMGRMYACDLYCSKNGNWLLTHEGENGSNIGEAIKKNEAKDLLMHYDYDAYVKHFGALEEA